jgi:hypothetical protein
MAIVFVFLRNNIQAINSLIIVAGAIFAARFFKEIHHSGNGVAYFMIPATQLEKLTVAILMTSFYYFAMMMITYIIGNLTGTLLNNMLASMDFFPVTIFHHSSLQWKYFEGINLDLFTLQNANVNIQYTGSFFVGFMLSQSLFLLGSIYFRKNHAFKTFLTIIGIQLLLVILISVELKLILGVTNIDGNDVEHLGKALFYPVKIFISLLPLFFWLVSYFRLTEKQV